MTELRDATLDTVHLAVLEGGEAVYIGKEDGLHPVQVTSRVGARCPAHCVATGKALLAFGDSAVRERLLNAGLTRYTPLDPRRGGRLSSRRWRARGSGAAPSTPASGGPRCAG